MSRCARVLVQWTRSLLDGDKGRMRHFKGYCNGQRAFWGRTGQDADDGRSGSATKGVRACAAAGSDARRGKQLGQEQQPPPASLATTISRRPCLAPPLSPSLPGLAAARHVCLRTQVSLVFPWPPHPAATPFLFSVRLPACDSLVPPRSRWRPRTNPIPALLASRPPTFPTPASALHPRTRIPRTPATTAAPPPSIATPPPSATATSLLALALASPRPASPSMSARSTGPRVRLRARPRSSQRTVSLTGTPCSSGGTGSAGTGSVRPGRLLSLLGAHPCAGYYVAFIICLVGVILFTVYHSQIVHWLKPAATWMHE